MRDDIKYQDIIDRLNDIVEKVAESCIPQGRRDGNYWRGDLHGKISVHIRGSRVGMVGFWQGQGGNAKNGGNLIHLIELAFGCKTHGEAVKIAKEQFLGIHKRELTAEEKRRWAEQQRESERKAQQRERDAQREKERKVETVRSVWDEAKPIAGTLAEAYLVGRSIELDDSIPGLGAWPPSLRFHPGIKHDGRYHPALIGGVQSVERKLIAIWRVFLGPDGKALVGPDGKKVKLGFGPATGGAVRFGPATPILRVTEGMETGLGVQRLTRNTASVWATLSTSGMVGFDIPPGVKRLEIYADGDRHREDKRTGAVLKPPGIAAAEKLAEKARAQGVEAVIFPSAEPDDWLDTWILRHKNERRYRNQ